MSYLKVAVNFRLIFVESSESIKNELKRRRIIVSTIEYVGISIILLTTVISFTYDGDKRTAKQAHLINEIVAIIFNNLIMIILGFSIYRIRKYSK